MALTHLDLARELLEGIDQRREARIEARRLGEWQTELNELARVLHYVLAHLNGEVERPKIRRPCCDPDDEMDEHTPG